MIDSLTRNRLVELGYLTRGDTSAESTQRGILRFQTMHSIVFQNAVVGNHKRAAIYDGLWGPASQKLLDLPRDCGCPDVVRDADGNEVAEARWPESCATELEFSFKDASAPGLNSMATRQGIAFALAEWNVAFQSPLSGIIYATYLVEWAKLIQLIQRTDQFTLWVGTVKHEVGHALGLPHTPGDPESVMYPSMRGQWLINKTDIANLSARGYSATKPIVLKLVDWHGDSGTHIWAKLGALPGSTLAWSMLANGSCSQRAEQRYDTTISWNRGKISLPDITPPPPPPGGREVHVTIPFNVRSGETLTISADDNGGWL